MLHEPYAMPEPFLVEPKKKQPKPMSNERLAVLVGKLSSRLLTTNDILQKRVPELSPVLNALSVEHCEGHLLEKPHHALRGLAHPKHIEAIYRFCSRIIEQLEYGLARQNESQLIETYLSLANYSVNPFWFEEKVKRTKEIVLYSRVSVAILLDIKRELEAHMPKEHRL